MSFAWETTWVDVCAAINVGELPLMPDGIKRDEYASRIFKSLSQEELYRIEKAALHGGDMDEQTDYAINELRKILVEKGILVLSPMIIETNCYRITITADAQGNTSITSNLRDLDLGEEPDAAMDALESFILALFNEGYKVDTPAFLCAIETTLDAIGNNS